MIYDDKFYADQADQSYNSALEVVPGLLEQFGNIQSVVDVGCGQGTWLRAFIDNGVSDVLGIDGDYVDRSMLRIPVEAFTSHNLETEFKAIRRFDCCISLEVAEHLKADASETFVKTLVSLSDLIVFSAAIPGQSGTNHINVQYQSWWVKLFGQHGYFPDQTFRFRYWNNNSVCPWYSQNMLVFAKTNDRVFSNEPKLIPYDVVHPIIWQGVVDSVDKADTVPVAVRNLIRSIRLSIKHRLKL